MGDSLSKTNRGLYRSESWSCASHVDVASALSVLSRYRVRFPPAFCLRRFLSPKVNFKSEEVRGYEVGVAVRAGGVSLK